MTDFDVDDLVDELAHYGVLGMKWGVRKDRTSGQSEKQPRKEMTSEQKAIIARRVAIGVGALTIAAGAAYAAHTLSKNGNLDLSLLKKGTTKIGKEAVQKIIEEPSDVIFASRGKKIGFNVLKKGDISAPFTQLEEAGLTGEGLVPDVLNYFGKHGEKIAVSLSDPKGRKDRAGRPITHDIIIPKGMSDSVKTINDVKTKIWPLLEQDYEAFWKKSLLEPWERR